MQGCRLTCSNLHSKDFSYKTNSWMLNIAKEEAWFSRASFMLMGATEAAQCTIYNNKHEAPKLIKHNWRGFFSQGGLFCSQDSPCSQGRHSQVINVSVHKGWEVLLVSTGSCCLCLSGCWRVSSTNYRTQKWSEHDATGKQEEYAKGRKRTDQPEKSFVSDYVRSGASGWKPPLPQQKKFMLQKKLCCFLSVKLCTETGR